MDCATGSFHGATTPTRPLASSRDVAATDVAPFAVRSGDALGVALDDRAQPAALAFYLNGQLKGVARLDAKAPAATRFRVAVSLRDPGWRVTIARALPVFAATLPGDDPNDDDYKCALPVSLKTAES